jgi:hypothetical protein
MILLDSGEATSPKFLPPASPRLGPTWAGTDALDRHGIDYDWPASDRYELGYIGGSQMGCKTFPPLTNLAHSTSSTFVLKKEMNPSVHLPPPSPASLLLPSPHCAAAT